MTVVDSTASTLRRSQPPAPSRLQQIIQEGRSSRGFWWMTGIEGTTIPHIEADEFEWIQHYRFWNEDLTMIRNELDANWIRLTFPWYKVQPAPKTFCWDWMDQVIARACELGFRIALDPVHFGTPMWMADNFADPDFPEHVANYFTQVARRYGQLPQVMAFVPHNEPTISALFGGLFGEWPPFKKDMASYNQLLSHICRGIVLAMEAVRAEVKDPVFLHIDAIDHAATRQKNPSQELLEEVDRINERRFVCSDLVSGRVRQSQSLTEWLLTTGLTEKELNWFEEHGSEIDIMGIDFYSHSEGFLRQNSKGKIVQDRTEHGPRSIQKFQQLHDSRLVNEETPRPSGLAAIMKDYYQRYQRPLVLTETDFCGTVPERAAWLGYTIQEMAQLRQEGIPALGYTWWGATDHLNWGLALKERNNIHPVGLWSLRQELDGTMSRVRTPLVDLYRHYVDTARTCIGDVALVEAASAA